MSLFSNASVVLYDLDSLVSSLTLSVATDVPVPGGPPPTGAVPPNAPSNLTATAGDALVMLTWTASVTLGVTGYAVYRSFVAGGTQALLASLGAGTVNYTDSIAIANGTTYFYTVRAVINTLESANSLQVNATPTAPLFAPLAPTGLAAVGGDTGVALTWTASTTPGLTAQTVYRASVTNGYTTSLITLPTTQTTYADPRTVAGATNYFYTVRVSIGSLESANAAEAAVTLPAIKTPLALTGLAGDNYTDLSWAPSAGAGITAQAVYRRLAAGVYTTPLTTIANNTTSSYHDAGATNGSTYYYTVRALMGTLVSGDAPEAGPLMPVAPVVTGTRTPLYLVGLAGDNYTDITWSLTGAGDPALGVTSQKVYRRLAAGVYGAALTTIADGTTYLYHDAGAANGQSYYYAVTSLVGAVESAQSLEYGPLAPTADVNPVTLVANPVTLSRRIVVATEDPAHQYGTYPTSYLDATVHANYVTTPHFLYMGPYWSAYGESYASYGFRNSANPVQITGGNPSSYPISVYMPTYANVEVKNGTAYNGPDHAALSIATSRGIVSRPRETTFAQSLSNLEYTMTHNALEQAKLLCGGTAPNWGFWQVRQEPYHYEPLYWLNAIDLYTGGDGTYSAPIGITVNGIEQTWKHACYKYAESLIAFFDASSGATDDPTVASYGVHGLAIYNCFRGVALFYQRFRTAGIWGDVPGVNLTVTRSYPVGIPKFLNLLWNSVVNGAYFSMQDSKDQNSIGDPYAPWGQNDNTDCVLLREVSYGLMAQIIAERIDTLYGAGWPTGQFIPDGTHILGKVGIWSKARRDVSIPTYPNRTGWYDQWVAWLISALANYRANGGWSINKDPAGPAFMFQVGNAFRALIEYDRLHPGDTRILPAIQLMADWIMAPENHLWCQWAQSWTVYGVAGDNSVNRSSWDDKGTQFGPTENALIAPAFAWLWIKTGDIKYRDIFDLAFSGMTVNFMGDALSNNNSGAQTDPMDRKAIGQSLLWMFDGVKWRQTGVVSPSGF